MAKKSTTPTPVQESPEKLKEIKLSVDKLEKEYGKNAVMLLGQRPKLDIDVISTGSLGLDIQLGIGGLPRGRIVEIYGPESSGKTTLAMHVLANAQKAGGRCAVIDAEHAFDPAYARNLGIDIDALYFSQPTTSEEGLNICDTLISTGGFSVILIDSVAALVPEKELQGEVGASSMGIQARLMSQTLRKITGAASKTNTLVIFINQLREKIGVMFGNPETTTGGNALKFYASIRLDIRKTGVVKGDGEDAKGNLVKVKVVKNKLAPPFKVAEFEIKYGQGIDNVAEILSAASSESFGIIKKSGSWYSYNNDKLGQGAEAVKQLLLDNEELFEEIKAEVHKKVFNNTK